MGRKEREREGQNKEKGRGMEGRYPTVKFPLDIIYTFSFSLPSNNEMDIVNSFYKQRH